MPMKLSQRTVNVMLPANDARELERLGLNVGDVVRDIIACKLDGDDGRFVLLKIPNHTYDSHIEFFDGDVGLALNSMAGSVECTGDDFTHSMKR